MLDDYAVNWPLAAFLALLVLAPLALDVYLMKYSFVHIALFVIAMVALFKYYRIAYH
jgi:hypothetical protein